MSSDGPEEEWSQPDWSETGRQLAESGKLSSTPNITKMMRRLRVLIVGGGAIGPVYGYFLKEGGAHVTMFVKPKYAADNEDGFTLHSYGVAGRRPKRHFQPDVVLSDFAELRAHTFDQVWLCVSSPALRDGFIERLHQACITASIWVTFQPRPTDRDYLMQTAIPSDRLVTGMVNFIAYRAPLPGEDLWPEGVAYFIPPWSMTKFSGEDELLVSAVALALQRGHGALAGSVVPDAMVAALWAHAVLLPFAIALESLHWSLHEMQNNQAVVDLVRNSVVDLQIALEQQTGVSPGKWRYVQKPWFWTAALFAAPHATAFPLEGYLKHHYSKLREQSDQLVDDLIELCRNNGRAPTSLEALREQWRFRREGIESLDPDEYDLLTGKRRNLATPMPALLPVNPAGVGVNVHTAPMDDSQSLVIGSLADMSSEFEHEDTPPPSVASELAEEPTSLEEATVPGEEIEIEEIDSPRERQVTPLPAAILPVPGITEEPIPIDEEVEPSSPELSEPQVLKDDTREPESEPQVDETPASEPTAEAEASGADDEPVREPQQEEEGEGEEEPEEATPDELEDPKAKQLRDLKAKLARLRPRKPSPPASDDQ